MGARNITYEDKDKRILTGSQQTILDIFRIIAAMFVIVGHSFSFYEVTIFKDQTYFPYIQNIGVVMLFLLSGFLTTHSLSQKNIDHKYRFASFFRHKAVRIAKEYIPGLILIFIIDSISIWVNQEGYLYHDAFNAVQFIGNALMLHSMGAGCIWGRWFIPFGSGRPLWTLAVEWWIYMLYGALYLFLSNKRNLSFFEIIILTFFVFMVGDYLISGRGGGLGFVFLLGGLSYYFYDLISDSVAIVMFVISFLAYIGYGVVFRNAYTVYSFIILWMLFCSAIKIGGLLVADNKYKRNNLLAFASKSTFMLYIIHYSIIDLIFHLEINCNLYIKFIAGIIISTLLASNTYYVFGEKGAMLKVLKKLRSCVT